ncbi:SET domain-containing protein 4 [Trichonephila clavata]|uniref:SET domain-containing protein 4 n=1 Tax=Trichonephila clavata TaxID=2740835 RepID=A0A8X6KZP7_TRICU|nr:SET domain-containing protein 4 [Trichonephila clavata]
MRRLLGRTFRKRRKKKAPNSEINQEAEEKYKNMCKWMREYGYKPSKKLKPRYFEDTGRGLMTKEKIDSGDTILCIPEKLLITPQVILKSELGKCIKKYCSQASGHQILSVFLMFEKSKEEASKWFHYIRTLPLTYDIPAFLGLQCLSMIPSFIQERALKQIEMVKQSYDNLEVLFKHLEQLFPFMNGNCGYNAYKWAWCAVNTRCVFIDCLKDNCIGKSCSFHLALAPFLDLLNHNIDTQVQAGFNHESKHYEIISLCNFKKYSQVFINYGSHDNCTLFLEYGFVIPNNFNDSIPFTIDDIMLAYKQCQLPSQLIDSKLKFILENNLIKNLVCSCDGLSWNLKIILNILITDYNIRLWKSKLCTYSEFEMECDNFKKICKELFQIKFKQITENSVDEIKNVYDYSNFQEQVIQLFVSTKSILMKFM